PHPRTPWRSVEKLPPAHALAREPDGTTRVWRYWTAPEHGSADLPTDELRALLDDAVDRQRLSDVPVGLLLSGGLDSSLLLALMDRHYQGDEIGAVTASYPGEARRLETTADDTPWARLVASRFPRTSLRCVVLDDA